MDEMARSQRFESQLDPAVERFLSSLRFDWRLLGDDVEGSLAHVAMLRRQGILPEDIAERIQAALQEIRREWQAGTLEPKRAWEDVHMNVEGRLHEKIGPEAGYLHTARSRNDQVAVDMHLYMRREGAALRQELLELLRALLRTAEKSQGIIMPGYTHLQPAQPILMAHYWLAYAAMFQRDVGRLDDWARRVDVSPLGAGALAGTPYPTNPDFTRQALGFSALYENSLDAVSDRDFLLEFLAWASLFMVHVSRLSEELVLWSSQEFGYLTMGDRYSTGSSIMPQKKNPDVAELLRGKSGRVFGHLMGLLTVMKGLPLAYHTDMQEDKEAVFDVVDTVHGVLSVLPGLLDSLTFHPDVTYQNAQQHYTNATDLADRLAQAGMPFRQAHHRVGRLVHDLYQRGYRGFHEVPRDVWNSVAQDIPYEWLQALTPEQLIAARQQPFATAPEAVARQLSALRAWLSANA
ncbi:MAG: argininosuccinate lyase [Firmicutes bacterium]|nr:argininosuccinate lyase [Bacillota bacterium]